VTRRAERFTEADIKEAVLEGNRLYGEKSGFGVGISPAGDVYVEYQGQRKQTKTGTYVPPQRPAQGVIGTVYFVACGEYVKIGFTSTTVDQRIYGMRTGNPYPMRVCLTVVGDIDYERRMHRKFRKHHHQFEWFHISDEIKDFILKNGGTLP
jgi:hypothetical protein